MQQAKWGFLTVNPRQKAPFSTKSVVQIFFLHIQSNHHF
jgi:hypothetical protein